MTLVFPPVTCYRFWMNEALIEAMVREMEPVLLNRPWGKIFQLGGAALAIDFRLADNRYLFLAAEPNQPRLYLIRRPVRALEKQSLPPSPFVMQLRKNLAGARLRALDKDSHERIVRFLFTNTDVQGAQHELTLIAQLTGRTANLLLLDDGGRIITTLRAGQTPGDIYQPPPPKESADPNSQHVTPNADGAPAQNAFRPFAQDDYPSLSEAADAYYLRASVERAFAAQAATQLGRVRKEIERINRLRTNLQNDLRAHGEAEAHKQAGDLLLANLATAERRGDTVRLRNFFAEGAPEIELRVDENLSLTEEASRRFARYGKAKRAAQTIERRLDELQDESAKAESERDELERIVREKDFDALASQSAPPANKSALAPQKRGEKSLSGVRRYRSSDDYEVLVGRSAKDNDQLTFRLARPHDLWFHAADYPGSHVVVVNHARKSDVPHRTIVEAAQLAAYFSQARADAKVDVHFTQRKFLAKPKGAAPGLVRMSQFRTLIVEPRVIAERL